LQRPAHLKLPADEEAPQEGSYHAAGNARAIRANETEKWGKVIRAANIKPE
jgi:hypothetical protein